MGKGLSPLQEDVLAVLKEFPALEEFPATGAISLATWARPRDILAALGREPTSSNRTAISKSLNRLCERGLVAAARGQLYTGKGLKYVRISGLDRA
jgi:hypothetical protein